MFRASLLSTVLLSAVAPVLAGQTRHFPPDAEIQAILDQQVARKNVAGIVVGLLEADGSRRILSAGKADNGDLKLDGNTIFEIGSITKTFTTGLLALMAAGGEVKLDDPVQKYLPASVKIPSRGDRQITLLDLASVNSGLPGMPNNFKPADVTNPYADYSVQQMYDFLNAHTLTRDIGAKYEYSNLGMGLLGHALALRAGKSYYDLVSERILRPLGMKDTWITLTPELKRRLALGHDQTGKVVSNWDIPTLAGAGALRSTVNDMFAYLAANLDSTSRLGKAFATTHVSRVETGSPAMTVGMGWHILKTPSTTVTWHNGGTGGYRTFTGFDKSRGVGVIVLTNSAISSDDVGLHLLDPKVPLTPPAVQRTAVTVDPAILARYAGVYQLQPEFTLTVTVEGGSLWVEATGQPKGPVLAESETVFFVNGADITLTFQTDSSGAATGLVLRQAGATVPAKKIR